MRAISVALKAHMQQDVTTMASLWKIKRVDGTIQGFTSHVATLQYDDGSGDGSITYKPSTGISPTSAKESVGSGVDNMQVMGIINSTDISDVDLLTGVYDRARVKMMLVNYADLTMGHLVLMTGQIGEIKLRANTFEAEVRSLTQVLGQQVGKVITPQCMVEFGSTGDFACNVNGGNLAPYTHTGTITSVTNRRIFYISALSITANIKQFGKCTFTGGNNNGRKMDIKFNDNSGGTGRIELQEEMPYDIQIGDTVSLLNGCSRLLTGSPTGCVYYSNALNFRGFPFVTGADAVLKIIPA